MKRFWILLLTEIKALIRDPISVLGGFIAPGILMVAFGLLFGGPLSFKIAMINLDRALRERHLRAIMVLQVHDEVVLEVPEDELDQVVALTRKVMESAYELCVPLKVDVEVGPNWYDMKEV